MPPRESVTEAFVEHRARVEAAAAHILRDHDEAKDIASDTFVAALEKGPDDADAMLPWLLTSARNKARNRVRTRIRARRREHLVSLSEQIDDPMPEGGTGGLLKEASDRLLPRDRAAVHLRHVEEWSYEDIAIAIGTSASQSRVIVHRATRRLRREVLRLVAERHNAPSACAKQLVKTDGASAHADCSPCTSVLDEVHAMTASGLLPLGVMHAAERLISAVATSAPMRTPVIPGFDRLGEAVAALALTISVAIAPTGIVTTTDAPARTGAEIAGAAPAASATGADALHSKRGPGPAPVAGFQGATREDEVGETANSTLTTVPLIVANVDVPDPLSDTYEPGVDISSLSVRTLLDGNDYEGFAFSMVMAGEPIDGANYSMQWRFGDEGDCSGSFSVYSRTANVNLTCFKYRAFIGTATVSQSFEVENVFTGSRIDVPIYVSTLKRDLAKMLQPGDLIRDIRASSSHSASWLGHSSDHAPDDYGSFDYRLGRG